MARRYGSDLELGERGNTLFAPSAVNGGLGKRCINSVQATFLSWMIKLARGSGEADGNMRQLAQSIIHALI